MGGLPKCLIKINQQPLLIKQISTLRSAGIECITVVTGYYHEQVEAIIADDASLNIVRNIAPERGQQSSVRLGLTHLQGNAELILITLADQPLIDANDLLELVQSYDSRPARMEILYPVVNGLRGNPVLMSASSVKDFLKDAATISCRQYIDTHASVVYQYTTQNEHFIADLDTPEDLTAFKRKTGLEISL